MKHRSLNTSNISVSLPKELHEVLRRAADDDSRSVSSLVSALVHTYLKNEGYIAPGIRLGEDVRPVTRQSRLSFAE
jgi:hypothetical protein